MNNSKKLIIQALILVIFTILLYTEWSNFDARIFYIELLCFSEIVIEFLYLFFNRKTITIQDKDKEIVSILIYLLVMAVIYFLNLIVVR